MPNPYFIPLNCDSEIGMIIQELASKAKQGHATFVLRVLLIKYKKEFVEKWGQQKYDELLEKYSMSMTEQKKERIQRQREKVARQRKRLELKERELTIREKNAGLRIEKASEPKNRLILKRERIQKQLEEARKKGNVENAQWCENKLREIDEELRALEVN